MRSSWSLRFPEPMRTKATHSLETGQQIRIPLRFAPPGIDQTRDIRTIRRTSLSRRVKNEQAHFPFISSLPRANRPPEKRRSRSGILGAKPRRCSKALGVSYQAIEASTDPAGYDLLIVGKGALTVDGPAPHLDRVHDGLRAIVFEQTAPVLEKRLGFRAMEYGLRQVFPR